MLILNLQPFLNTGVISPVFQIVGNVAQCRELLNSFVSMLAIDEILSIRAVMPSPPVDDDALSAAIALVTSACSTGLNEKLIVVELVRDNSLAVFGRLPVTRTYRPAVAKL